MVWCKIHCMKKVIFAVPCVVLLFLSVVSVPLSHHRDKRTIFQLCGLINYYTERSCWDYNDYGCFCGLGNSGHKPVDDADACCRKHDNCYGRLSCYWYYPQWIGYEIQCSNTTSTCNCLDNAADYPCARSVCDCDVGLANCLKDAAFSGHYKNYDRHLCRRGYII